MHENFCSVHSSLAQVIHKLTMQLVGDLFFIEKEREREGKREGHGIWYMGGGPISSHTDAWNSVNQGKSLVVEWIGKGGWKIMVNRGLLALWKG